MNEPEAPIAYADAADTERSPSPLEVPEQATTRATIAKADPRDAHLRSTAVSRIPAILAESMTRVDEAALAAAAKPVPTATPARERATERGPDQPATEPGT